ncbi:hypothetical protein C5167_011880 [Papaver somniferum]|uniref:Uncharacterized protein n=1 Tax=Papaver somniferum TaxID=3469 RepID=A0A4Y7IZU5_PAPSO|nr:hypothetical protein C5167_011880 [Papaver somniferum]
MSYEEAFEVAKKISKLPSTEKDVYAKHMMKHLGAVSAVKQMKLSPVFLELLSQAPDLLDCQPPRLSNL